MGRGAPLRLLRAPGVGHHPSRYPRGSACQASGGVSGRAAAAGLAVLAAALRGLHPPEVSILAVACAVGLTAIDVTYVTREVIAPIYLVDAAVHVVLLAAWVAALARARASRPAGGARPA